MKLEIISPSLVEAELVKQTNPDVAAVYKPKFYERSLKGHGPLLVLKTDGGKLLQTYSICIDGRKGTLKLEQRKQTYSSPLDV